MSQNLGDTYTGIDPSIDRRKLFERMLEKKGLADAAFRLFRLVRSNHLLPLTAQRLWFIDH
jgi:hypothetical protein